MASSSGTKVCVPLPLFSLFVYDLQSVRAMKERKKTQKKLLDQERTVCGGNIGQANEGGGGLEVDGG